MTATALVLNGWIRSFDKVLAAFVGLFVVVAVLAPRQAGDSLGFVAEALIDIAPFLLISVAVAAATKASGADDAVARVFAGHPARMILAAALFGSLSPFCSCGVIPLIAALLTAGVPLAPVMAFWISSPLMDPQMFILTAAALGLPFAVAKTVAAICIGALGGFATRAMQRAGLFADPLAPDIVPACSSCQRPQRPDAPPPQWIFWTDAGRNRLFAETAWTTGWFLFKWLSLAFAIESLMLAYVPASLIAGWLGDADVGAIPLAVVVGVPAYLNGYAAVPLVAGLMEMGMAHGAALAFMIAGGMTSIPAAMAVFALVRRPVFAWYLVLALAGSTGAGFLFQMVPIA
ncbi:MAG: permease [Rhodospirillales bacterium]|jgi:hypothetical protein|nr:permease [Rhodospirillales bacterium]MDP6882820.1 permease [Rhodospirillales bacterium]